MKSFAERYNYKAGQIALRSFTEVVLFAEYCGADIDVSRCSKTNIRYTIATRDGKIHPAGGFSRPQLLFRLLNEVFGLKINVKLSGKAGQVFRLKFDEVPFNLEEKQNEDQQETAKEDSAKGDIQEPEVLLEVSETEEAEVQETVEQTEELPNLGALPEPEWDSLVPLKASKKKVKELAASYGIDLDTKPKYPLMIENFKQAYKEL